MRSLKSVLSRYFRAEITGNLPLNINHNLLSLKNLDSMSEPVPGQFYMVEVNKGYDPLLKRAFSLFRRTAEGIQLLYRVQGKGTEILRNLKEGAEVPILGPLGNGYPSPPAGSTPVVIAGGIGIASVYPLIEKLDGRACVLYGARTGSDLFMLDELSGLSQELHLCTDDGSRGDKGTVADLLIDLFAPDSLLLTSAVIYACGPRPMLHAVSKIASQKNITAYLSLEEHMACGIGACLGCVAKIKELGIMGQAETYQRVCKEGPVFDSREIIW